MHTHSINLPANYIVTGQMLEMMNALNSFAVCDPAPVSATKMPGWPCKSKKDENPMKNAYATATLVSQDTTEKDQRRYLRDELYSAYSTAKLALQRKFGLKDDEAPATLTEAIKRITDGLFVIPEEYKDKAGYTYLSYLRWRDPKAVEDKIGYEAAKTELKTAMKVADRKIAIFAPAEGLQAVIDFEAAVAK